MLASSASPLSPSKERVLIPSTSATWDVDSSCCSSDSASEEEVEEVLLQPASSASVPQRTLPLRSPVSRRDSLILSGELGDDLPGAKARKVMGISVDSGFEDWDKEECLAGPDAPSTLRPSRSLRNAFKLSSRSKRGGGHQRGSSVDAGIESGGESDTGETSIRRRRPSLSSLFGGSTTTIASVATTSPSSVPSSPRLQAALLPISHAGNLLKRRPTLNVPKTAKSSPAPAVSPRESEWNRELDSAAKLAAWHTSIEHRPKRNQSACSIRPTLAEIKMPQTTNNVNVVVRKPSNGGIPTLPSPSPALTRGLHMARSASIDDGCLSFADLRRPSLPASPTPPRPPRSSLRTSKGQGAIVSPPTLQDADDGANQMEYIRRDTSVRHKKSSALDSSSPSSRNSCNSSPSPYCKGSRQSIGSSTYSEDGRSFGCQSPGLSVSSTATSGSTPDLRSLIMDGDTGRPISPFTKPRKAPTPPIDTVTVPIVDTDDCGLGLTLEQPEEAQQSTVLMPSPRRPVPPCLHRQDSELDPDLLTGAGERDTDTVIVTPTLLHHKGRPTSVPFSPPSAHIADFALVQEDEQIDDNRDEFMLALDKLDCNLELKDALSLGNWERPGRLGIPISLVHTQDDSVEPAELSPRGSDNQWSTVGNANACPLSLSRQSTLSDSDYKGWSVESDVQDPYADDINTVHFFRIYSQS